MAQYRIAEFIENNKSVFFIEEKTFVEVEFLKIFTKNKIVWIPLKGQSDEGYNTIGDANNFIKEYKKTLPKYHYIK
jgi:hypothetical protein